MISYIENLKEATRKLLECINELVEVAGCKINTQKYFSFLQTKNERLERKIKEAIPFSSETKGIKYLGINVPQETKDLYSENYKILTKEMKHGRNQWRDIPCLWIRKINIVKMIILPKVINTLYPIPIKLPKAIFTYLGNKKSLCMETQKISSSQSKLDKEKQKCNNHAV